MKKEFISKSAITPEFKRRLGMTLVGVLVSGFSVGMFQFSEQGMDPFQVLSHGLFHVLPIGGFGTFYMLFNLAILIFDLVVLDRKKIGLGTFINMFLLGYVVEFSAWLWNTVFPSPALWLRIVMLILGILIMCMGSSLYIVGDMGVSTYDAIALTISERRHFRFFIVRVCSDLVCVVIGIVCWINTATAEAGSSLAASLWQMRGFIGVGLGTIVTAFFMGPLIEYFSRFSRRLRSGGFSALFSSEKTVKAVEKSSN